jgi:endonuclease YncB( thermonuclease family)
MRIHAHTLLRFAVIAVLASLPTALQAADLRDGGIHAVAEVIDGDTFALADGREVRLVGIQSPKLALGRPGFKDWPLATDARETLATLLAEGEVSLRFGTTSRDRYGRLLAHVFVGDTWVQGAMLEAGMARVYSFEDNRQLVAEMLAVERAARAAGHGIWALEWYAVRAPADLAGRRDRFELVEGRVLNGASAGGRGYLNFGEDWKSDFTIVISPQARRLFEREGHPMASYEGRRVRVRGWIEFYNGPMVEVTHPEQIEVLDR